jgi:uncharacterized protein YdaU (DUF1376 family)
VGHLEARRMKNDDYWYAWRPIQYKRKTQHLSLAEDCAYRRLIDEYMLTRDALPDKDAAIARIIGVSIDEWLAVAPAVRPYFEASNGKLINKHCEEELHTQAAKSESRSNKAKASADARWRNYRELKDIHAVALQTHSERNANAVLGDATQHNNTSSSLGDGSLARSLSGAQRSPSGQQPSPPDLKHLVSKWTGGRT